MQNYTPVGTPGDGRRGVKRLIEGCAPGVGFILSPAHNIQSDTPVENVEAFYAAAREFGSY